MFRIKIRPLDENDLKWFRYDVEIKQTKHPNVAIVITSPTIGVRKAREYGRLKQRLAQYGIPCQFIMEDNVKSGNSALKYSGVLRNIALGIYAKAGGIPWILSDSLGEGKCFIGLQSITRRQKKYTSLQVFDENGLWLGGWTNSMQREDFTRFLRRKLTEATKLYAKEHHYPKEVIVHKDGEVWPDRELKPINEALRMKHRVVAVKRLGIPRIYDIATRTDYVVERGTYVQVDENEAILETSGPPHQILGTQKPLTIEIKYPISTEALIKETCREVFLLSLIYGGYALAVTSKPITTHFASKAATLAANYEIEETPNLWRKAWFV